MVSLKDENDDGRFHDVNRKVGWIQVSETCVTVFFSNIFSIMKSLICNSGAI